MGENKYEIFYNLIKFWTLNDFCTPNIKAEVIFDMLLSPFITDIVKEGMNSNGRFVLLAKEFPLKVDQNDKGPEDDYLHMDDSTSDNNKGPKVDYLLMDDSTSDLYLVELKTDNNSFNKKQYSIYLETQKNSDIGENFCRIIKDNTQERYYQNFGLVTNVKGSNKYIRMLKQMAKILDGRISGNIAALSKDELAEAIKGFLKGQTIHLVYVSINEIKVGNKSCEELYEGIKNIHLDNIEMYKNNPEKRSLWDLVHSIIKETNSEGTFANLWNKDLLK